MRTAVIILVASHALGSVSGVAPRAEGPGTAPSGPAVQRAWQPGEGLALAKGSITGEVQVLNTRRFRQYLTADPAPEVQATLRALEGAWNFYAETLGSLVELPEQPEKIALFVLSGPVAMDRFAQGLRFPPDGRGAGVMWNSSPPFIAFDPDTLLGPSDLGVLLGTVVRVAHDVLLYDPDVVGSWWVREGFAIYLTQTVRTREGAFVPGEVRTSAGYIEDVTQAGRMADGLAYVEEPLKALKRARREYESGDYLSLTEVLAVQSRHRWSDEETREPASVIAWILVHFLLHGEQGELRPRPASFLKRERRGEGGVQSFRDTVSGDIDRFEVFLYAHTKKMK